MTTRLELKIGKFQDGSIEYKKGARIETETDAKVVFFLPTDSRVGFRTNEGDNCTLQDSHTRGGHVSVFKNGLLDFVIRKKSRSGGVGQRPRPIFDRLGKIIGNIEYLGKSTEE